MSEQARQLAMALGRKQSGQGQPGDDAIIEAGMGGDLALLIHCGEADGERVTIVIGVQNWAHAAACIASPAIADDLASKRRLFEIVSMSKVESVRHPLGEPKEA